MAYTANYDTTDVTEATIDGLVVFIITVVGFAGIIALIMTYKWAVKKVR